MRNVFSIFRRDLGAYFTSPVGYIFIMVFVTISVGLYITSFFSFPVADMRPYFDNLPLLLCIFIPAVTMRVWAEERKENTWEMLLTFPMQVWQLVLGKFFAALVFFAAALLATVTVPAMLFSLGNPDPGAITSGYLGTMLLGGFFLALGILFSGFFKDQIVAFVITLLTCFVFFLVGTGFIAAYIDDRFPGLGSLLSDLLGLFKHHSAFTRGVIDVADVLYFLAWTILFLVLNIMYIDGRSRPGARLVFSVAVALCVVIGLLFNWLMVGRSFLRFDVTEDKIYTVSDASKAILSAVDTPVQIKVYITPRDKMPTEMKDLEQNIADKLDELRVAAEGKLEYVTVYLEARNAMADSMAPTEEKAENEEEAVEKRMLDKGVEPFNVQARSQDKVTNQLVYSSIGVGYKDKAEEIIPQVMPQTLEGLEYRLVSTIYKLTREKAPVVALVAPKEAINLPPQVRAMYEQMGRSIPESEDPYVYLERILDIEKYEVRRVDLTKESPLPDEYDTLVVVNPRGLNDRQRWEINRAMRSGKSVVMAVQQYEWDYRATSRGNSASRRDETPDVNPLLEAYGLGVSARPLMDVNAVTLTVQGEARTLQDLMRGGQPFDIPTHVLVNNECMDQETALTNRLSAVFYLWGTPIELNEDKLKELKLAYHAVMSSSARAWTIDESTRQLTNEAIAEPPESERKAYPLMAVVEGQFPDAFAGKERPKWPKPEQPPGQPPLPEAENEEEPAPAPIAEQPGKLILLGCSEMFRKNFLQADNLDLFLNCVDAVTLNENLVYVRGRKPIDRMIGDIPAGKKTVWRMTNYGLANVLIAAVGIAVFLIRRTRRNAYTMAHYAD